MPGSWNATKQGILTVICSIGNWRKNFNIFMELVIFLSLSSFHLLLSSLKQFILP